MATQVARLAALRGSRTAQWGGAAAGLTRAVAAVAGVATPQPQTPLQGFSPVSTSTRLAHSDAAAADKRTFEVVRLVQKDKPKVLEFLRKFFYHDEPLNTAIGLRAGFICPTLEEFSLSTFDEGISVGAVAADGTLVGVCINACLTREEDEQARKEWAAVADDVVEDARALEDDDARFAQIQRMLSQATAEGEVFQHAPADLDRIFDIFILSVDSSWRGKGIATKLLDRSREIAQADGHRLMRIVCTSFVSALIASRMGYRCIAKVDYKTVLDRKGQRVFPTEPPHDAVTTYVLDI